MYTNRWLSLLCSLGVVSLALSSACTLALPTPTPHRVGTADVVDSGAEKTAALPSLPPDIAASLAINGPAVTAAISMPEQNSHMEFVGTAGQQVTVTVTNNTLCNVQVDLYREATPTLTSFATTSCPNRFHLPPQTLPETGQYLIFIDPSHDHIGSLTLKVTSP